MKIKKSSSLVTALIVTIVLLLVVMFSSQIAILNQYTKSITTKSYGENCQEITNAYSLMLNNRLNMFLREVRVYVDADIVQDQHPTEIVKWMCDRNQKRSYNIDGMYFVTPDGKAYRDDGTVTDFKDKEIFKEIIINGNYEYVSNPEIDEVMKKPVFYVAQVAIANGKKLGFFAGVYPLSSIQKMIYDIQLGQTGNAWLLANDGTVIAYPYNGYAMKKNFLKDLSSDHKDLKEISQKMVNGETGSGWITSVDLSEKEYVTYTQIHNTPWSLGFNISESQIRTAANGIKKILFFSSIIIALLIALCAGILLYKKLNPLRTVNDAIEEIATGSADLTKRINMKSNNEIGAIVHGFNGFSQKLQSIITELKTSQETLAGVGELLENSTKNSAVAINDIKDSIIETTSGIVEQTESIETTSTSVNEISSNILSLEKMISNQMSAIEEASSSVTQMIGNIDSINHSFEYLSESFSDLSSSAEDGLRKQTDVNKRIMQIESESKMLQEANAAIASIASQTNLLAMNAAIEAAHAGEAGKGFSVVAAEIRKLSETSTSQSKTIGESLVKIRNSIVTVVEASQNSINAYDSISNKVKATDKLVMQIHEGLNEQKIGSTQIVEALKSMNESSFEVRSASAEMTEGSKHILSQVSILKDSTLKMKGCMNKMDTGTTKIDVSGTELIDISAKVNETIAKIGTQIDQFKV